MNGDDENSSSRAGDEKGAAEAATTATVTVSGTHPSATSKKCSGAAAGGAVPLPFFFPSLERTSAREQRRVNFEAGPSDAPPCAGGEPPGIGEGASQGGEGCP